MASMFENLVNGMVNVSFGAAAMAAEKGKGFLDDLATKGAEVRSDPEMPDFARSLSDAFKAAGGTVSDVTERLSTQGESMADKVLDELILLRARQMDAGERPDFLKHVQDLVDNADAEPVKVKVESVEVEGEPVDADEGEKTE